MPVQQAARVRAGLKVLKARHGTDKATAAALSLTGPTISRVTVGAVLRIATGPSVALAMSVARAMGMRGPEDLYALTVAEIAARGAS